ncbi:MAG: hypothetical protein AAFU34_15695 [Pseudomonadota bacterium]
MLTLREPSRKSEKLAQWITATEVARIAGFNSAETFLRRRHSLEEHMGFPLPNPLMYRPLKWHRADVETWVLLMRGGKA